MQVLINGKSRFGLVGATGRQPLPVRAIVVDGAHAALALAEDRTFLRIPSSHPAHKALLEMIDEDLSQQGINALLDIREGDPTATPLRIPFWAWYDKLDQVLQTLRPHRSDTVFEWSWPLVADILPWRQATISAEMIEITPLCPPIEKLPSFADAERRIYLTATLADDSVLVTHFNADAQTVSASIVPDSAADLGDRLILAPQELNPSITHEAIRATVSALANDHNVVVLVPSHRQASLWNSEADATVSTSEDHQRRRRAPEDGPHRGRCYHQPLRRYRPALRNLPCLDHRWPAPGIQPHGAAGSRRPPRQRSHGHPPTPALGTGHGKRRTK